jgi:ribose 5-phosphate isomerase B
MRVAVGSDHAGFELKEKVKHYLAQHGIELEDFGTLSTDSVDYPDYAEKVARAVQDGRAERGILMCGTGIGVSIAANKLQGIRAALASEPEVARLSREHNDANVLCLPARYLDPGKAGEIVKTWLETPFQHGRHERRIEKIRELEDRERRHE